MTGLHAVHVTVGMSVLAWLTCRSRAEGRAAARSPARARRDVLAPRRHRLDLPLAALLPHREGVVVTHDNASHRSYFFVFATLLALAAISYGISFTSLGAMRVPAAIAISVAKASLVVFIFMELIRRALHHQSFRPGRSADPRLHVDRADGRRHADPRYATTGTGVGARPVSDWQGRSAWRTRACAARRSIMRRPPRKGCAKSTDAGVLGRAVASALALLKEAVDNIGGLIARPLRGGPLCNLADVARYRD